VAPRTWIIGTLALLMLCRGANAFADAPPPDGSNTQQQQTSPTTGTTKKLGTIYVTGSHIRSIDLETQHPLTVLEREDLLRTGLSDIGLIVQNIVVNGQTQNRNINNGTDARELVNLRSLGPNRTLVLVNGQRWVSGLDGAVDLSAIPLSLVERVEVLKDGASAIYGSDAIAGVINIITRKNFKGAQLGSQYGQTDHGDGIRRDVEFSYGRSGDRWNVSFGVEYAKDDPVMAGDRTISSMPVAGLPLGATGVVYMMFRHQGGRTLIAGRPGTSPDDFRPFDVATDANINYTTWNYLQTPLERKAMFAQGRFELTPNIAVLGDFLFNRRQSEQQLAPPRVNFGSFCCGGAPNGFDPSPDSVYNPFDDPVTAFQRRFLEDRSRRWQQRVDTSRWHLALDGLFDVAGRSIAWGADVSHARADQRETIDPFQDNTKLTFALGPSFFDASGEARCGTPAAPIDGCVPLDVFGPPGSITPAMLDYVDVQASNRMETETRDLLLHATTTLAELPAGGLNVAVGAEYRHESGFDDPDELLATGRANGGGINYRPTEGAYSVKEAFVEFEIPLLAEHAFARQLGLDVASRRSDYSLFGSTTNSQFGLRWKPIDDLLLRASYIEGFRAPSVVDLFQGLISTGEGSMDPCAADSHSDAATLARCAAAGVPADVTDWGGTAVTLGGNPALRPETARTRTLGFVYAPSWAPGLDMSLDWYRIQIANAIGERTAQSILDACYTLGDANACALVTRDPADHVLSNVDATQQNIPGGLEVEGYDYSLGWRRDTPFGPLQLRWDNAYVSYYGEIGQPATGTPLPDGSPAQGNVVGKNAQPGGFYGVVWRLRSVMVLAWQRGAWAASIAARYFSPVTESCQVVAQVADTVGDPSLLDLCSDPGHVQDGRPTPLNRVGAVTYFDLQAGWTAPWQGRFTLGVRNAFDRDPPVAYSANANSFFPDYDIPGRFFYLGYRQGF
jgi:iron complex outermembrane receptor protein